MMHSRRKTLLLGVASHSAAQGITVITGILSVPIGLHYLGISKFGVWMVVQALMIYLSSSQFGIGSVATALMAKLTEIPEQKAVLLRSFRLLAGFGFLFLCLVGLAALYPAVWSSILGKVPATLQSEAANATIILAVFYLLRLPFITFAASFVGLQEVYLERFYGAILPSVTNLLALVLTAYQGGGLVMLALLMGSGSLAISIVSGIHFFARHKELIPIRGEGLPKRPASTEILRSGGYFFIVGLAAMVVWNTDNLVISHFLGPDYVASYSIVYKLFTIAYAVFIVLNAALWPMLGRAVGQGDWAWVSATYDKATLLLPILGGLVWIGGMAFAKDIIYLWVGPSGYAGPWVVFAFGGCGYLLALVNMHASFLGGINVARPLMWAGISEALVNIALSVYLVQIYGTAGVAMGTLLASLLTVFWLLPIIISRNTQGKVRMAWKPLAKHTTLAVLPSVLALLLVSEYCYSGWQSFLLRVTVILLYLVTSWWILPSEMSAMLKAAVVKKISPIQ
jgi:O-antigen/teichoic acid export membrane protein